jgi:hypothetical protein
MLALILFALTSMVHVGIAQDGPISEAINDVFKNNSLCCKQIMLTLPEDENRVDIISLDVFNRVFNQTELPANNDSPKYKSGPFCIEKKLVILVHYWRVIDCESGDEITRFKGTDLSKCIEDAEGDWEMEIGLFNKPTYTPTVDCVGANGGSGSGSDGSGEEGNAGEPTQAATEGAAEAATEEAATEEATEEATNAPTEAATEEATEAATNAPTEAATEEATEAATNSPSEAINHCEPCRDVLDGPLSGYYQLQSDTDPRCDDRCSYTNDMGDEFCFVEGGYKTSLECQ